jgi:hypothetical protein
LPYDVQATPRDEAYLAALPLSERARRSVEEYAVNGLAYLTDADRESNRVAPGSPYVRMQFNFRDWWGDRRGHRVDFVVNDAHAVHGVLLLVYVEHHCPG